MPAQPVLYLEDFVVGARYESDRHALSAEQTIAFARTFDPQPFHVDPAAAEHSFFHGLAASGWHTAAITMRLLVESVPVAGGLIGAGVELRWPTPTRPDDVLHVESVVTAIKPSRSKPDRGIVTMENSTLNDAGEERQHTVSHLLVFRRGAA